MACRQIFRAVGARTYSTAPAAKKATEHKVSLPKKEAKLTSLPNGIVVASQDDNSPVSKVAVVFKAGTRYEHGVTRGANHVLRSYAGLSTKGVSTFELQHELQLIGGSLNCTSGREHLSYTLECNRDKLDAGMHYLTEVATNPSFFEWELSTIFPKMRVELLAHQEDLESIVMENLHKAAFRSGLGNSLYCPEYAFPHFEHPLINHYVSTYCSPSRMAVVGVGVDHEALVNSVSKISGGSSGAAAQDGAAKYGGGEIRTECGSPVVYAAVASEGYGLTKPKEAVALAVLQQILGVGPRTKRAPGSSKLSAAVAKSVQHPALVSALNVSYSDSGLFGFCVAATAGEVGKAIKAAVGVVNSCSKSGGVSEQDVTAAKAKLKAEVSVNAETACAALGELSVAALVNKKIVSANEADKLIDSVTAADVTNAAKKIASGKPSMATVGNLAYTPYLDQLTS